MKGRLDITVSGLDLTLKPLAISVKMTCTGDRLVEKLRKRPEVSLPPGSFLVVHATKVPYVGYRPIECEKPIGRFASLAQPLEVLIVPQYVLVSVHCPDKSEKSRNMDTKKSATVLCDEICQLLHLYGDLAYCFYPDPNVGLDPIPTNKTLSELCPFLTDLTLKRRFWVRDIGLFTTMSDINFTYNQARDMVFDADFDYMNYDIETLVAIHMLVEYEERSVVKGLIKKIPAKNKLNSDLVKFFPTYLLKGGKNKKRRTTAVDRMKFWGDHDRRALKVAFIDELLKNKFFGSTSFLIEAIIPGRSGTVEPCMLTVTEDYMIFRDRKTKEEWFSVKNDTVKNWKPTGATVMEFLHGVTKNMTRMEINHPHVMLVVDHFTALVNFLKWRKLQEKLRDAVDTKHTDLGATAGSSMSMMSELTEQDDSLVVDPNFMVVSASVRHVVLPCMEEPNGQEVVTSDASLQDMDYSLTEANGRFSPLYTTDKIGFEFEDKPKYQIHSDMIAHGCKILKNYMSNDLPMDTIAAFVKTYLTWDQVLESNIAEILEGPRDGDIVSSMPMRVSMVSNALSSVLWRELPPLDAFASLNYARSLLLRYARQKWKDNDFHFTAAADTVSEELGGVVKSAVKMIQRVSHPMASAIFDACWDSIPESRDLLMVNEQVTSCLFLGALSVAQACCDAGIEGEKIQPIMAGIPKIPVFDMVTACQLADVIYPIITDVAADEDLKLRLMQQPHISSLEMASIVNGITEFYTFCHFMRSPIGMFIEARAPRLVNPSDVPPVTLPDAGTFFRIARQMANLLWSIDSDAYGALSMELVDLSRSFYELFTRNVTDISVRLLLENAFSTLCGSMKEGAAILRENQELLSLLKHNIPLHDVLLSMSNMTNETKACTSFLALQSVENKHLRAMIRSGGLQLDEQLRATNEELRESERDRYEDMYSVFALAVVEAVPEDKCDEVRSLLVEVGMLLMKALFDIMPSEQRRDLCEDVRDLIRPLLSFAAGDPDALARFLEKLTDRNCARTYLVTFALRPPDLGRHRALLARLAIIMSQFRRTTVKESA